ncbi:aspartate/glutamate racemase family protein [Aliiglaciecola sp. 2_MG-2023]|uniref:aspartate/glutamate racemase family protein n=1 Tax=unclassified Aliiglaciecola TaxID=2593648 RepID=UPI0026E2D195|nr:MULTISPECIES: aspartate/glutamate racemase family protein [unclassified Aliiglaciecola]MDO6712265.1 aspartate/glutamate racemase family protein [Aliiglaciecola sp. 2_MG-2023]MDO6753329.1 aspartate/glutamate racemase family protein [Aliiglaciecola sp. 1_MG-2023]
MRTIGLIGGMSWESTVSYYQVINRQVKLRLGGFHSAKLILHSVDFAQIERLQHLQKWQELAELLADAARGLELAGAECVVICTNTMHKVADKVEQATKLPLIHIADATAKELVSDKIQKVGLLGTRFTMEQDFYRQRIQDKFAIEVLTPDQSDRDFVHQVIYDELCLGKINSSSRKNYLNIIQKMYQQGAQAIILGCTEIALLINQNDTDIPLYNTTDIHALAAVDFSLNN